MFGKYDGRSEKQECERFVENEEEGEAKKSELGKPMYCTQSKEKYTFRIQTKYTSNESA